MIVGEFYVLGIDSVRYKDRYTIRLNGKTADGRRLIVLDPNFDDYFYILSSDSEDMQNFLKGITGVKEVKIEKMKIRGDPVEVVKVILTDTHYAQEIKDYAKKNPSYIDHLEMDIPTFRRYMIDKKIFPPMKVKFEGEEIKSDHIKTILASKISGTEDFLDSFKFLSFDIETYSPIGIGLKGIDRPIIIISLYGDNFKKVITTKKFETRDEDIIFVETEYDLLKKFEEIVNEYDPDVIFGYGTDVFDFPYMNKRGNIINFKLRLGIDNSEIRESRGRLPHVKIFGRIHIDLYQFVRNILSPSLETETYDLSSVASEILGEGKYDKIKGEDVFKLFDNKEYEKLCKYCQKDSELTYKLGLKFFPIITELTKIVGQPIFDVSRMTYGLCDEWFLIRNAHKFYELVPDKPLRNDVMKRLSNSYSGAYVHQPKPGLYEDIIVFDFRSLYPSIIVSHNICPTTVDKNYCKSRIYTPSKSHWFCKGIKGMIPSLLKELIERRAEIKRLLKKMEEGTEKNILEARSYALKTIANAMYGYMGFPRSRWYSIACAESVTEFGRYYIKNVIKKFEDRGFEVVYGDTDSIMVASNGKKEEIMKIQNEINKELPSYMELDYQGFYPRGIFVSVKEGKRGAKKRYALLDENGKIVIKGFEYVRRDWAEIAKKVQIEVLQHILKEKSIKKAIEVIKRYIDELKSGNAKIEDIEILTQITRPIKMYESKGPHVSAVIKAKKEEEYIPGSIVRYIVCIGKGKISDRSYLVEEYEKKGLKYDPDYYINNQIIPAVGKIFEVLGYDINKIVEKQTGLEKFFN